MMVYIGLTCPVDKDSEARIESCILEWFHTFKREKKLHGIIPYDPITMEFGIEAEDQDYEPLAASIEAWVEKLDLENTDVVVSDRPVLDGMSREGRVDHLKRKIHYLTHSLGQINRTLSNPRLRHLEFLLAGVAEEADSLLAPEEAVAVPEPPPIDEDESKALDDFWRDL